MSVQPQHGMLYHFYFLDVFRRRMHYVNKICLLLAFSCSTLLNLPYGGFWWNFVDSLYCVPVLFLASWLVKNLRTHNSTVEYSQAKTLAEHIARSTLFSGKFFTVFVLFLASGLLFFTVVLVQLPLRGQYYVLAKEFRMKPAVNDAWVYFWFHAVFSSFFYGFQHVAFQRNRLLVPYGISSVKPESSLFSKPGFLLGTSVFFCGLCSTLASIVYLFARPIIYKLSWPAFALLSLDTSVPPLHIGAANFCNVTFASLVLFLLWETINHTYNTYATIGCLDGKTALSSRSADPVATLLSGMRATEPCHELSRATAFQELAYISCASDKYCVKTRNNIYNTRPKGNLVWPAILDECSLVIRSAASRINFRSKHDMDALRNTVIGAEEVDVNVSFSQKDLFIFGNSHDTSSANDTTQFAIGATSSPLKKSDHFEPAPVPGPIHALTQKFVSAVWTPLNQSFEALYRPAATRKKEQLKAKTFAWKTFLVNFYEQVFLASRIGVLFRTTLKRDAESRVVCPAIYGNAVLALTGLIMHAVEEDRSCTVTSAHVSEALNTLERPIRSSANYADILPTSVYLSPAQRQDAAKAKLHLVAEMHDLTMTEFFHLCVKYNYKLNDLLLSLRAFKLAKWVTDVSIAQQQKQEKTQMGKFL